jgi:aryl sulfotransferase
MAGAVMGLPQKEREIQTVICDSTRWNGFTFRDDGIIIATYAKTGTTWTQQIAGQLIFGGKERDLFEASPWVDFRLIPLDQMTAGWRRSSTAAS